MFRQRAFDSSVIVSTAALLLLVLPLSGECQSDEVQTQELSEPIEEIVVLGTKSLIDLTREMYKAEEALYDLFNSLNSNDEFDILCYKEAPTGSHIKQRICRTKKLGDILAEATQESLHVGSYIFPTLEIKKMNERMLAEMTEIASDHPEYVNALITYTEARETLVSEHKRRCEGRFLICRRQ
jgi:hypothetical protein